MARADLLLSLVKAARRGDDELVRKTVEALIAEERTKQHHVLADQLTDALDTPSNGTRAGVSRLGDFNADLFLEISPDRRIEDLILPKVVIRACSELVEEQHRAELLRSYNLEPRNRVLLTGPPGNGKTSLAEAIATASMMPLLMVRYESVIASFLGETAARLRRLFDFVRTRRCVLFFDEFDTLGKERGDEHELGEIKRVVSSLLLQIDQLPSHVVVVTATNHPELLDRAVWRRFQLRLELPPPTPSQIGTFLSMLQERTGLAFDYVPKTLAEKLKGASFAEVEDFATDVHRRYVMSLPEADLRGIVRERLEHWASRVSAQ